MSFGMPLGRSLEPRLILERRQPGLGTDPVVGADDLVARGLRVEVSSFAVS